MSQLLGSALLAIVDEAGRGVLTLTEGLAEDEFLRSRLTRAEVLRLLRELARGLGEVPDAARERLPEIDWPAWRSLRARIDGAPSDERSAALWFAVQSLVPATLLWLEVYRRDEPALFRMSA